MTNVVSNCVFSTMAEAKKEVKMKTMMVKHQPGPEVHHRDAVHTGVPVIMEVSVDEDVRIVAEDAAPDLSATAMTMMIAKIIVAMKNRVNDQEELDAVIFLVTIDHVDTHQYVARVLLEFFV